MASLTSSYVDVALAIKDKLEDNAPGLGLEAIFYGDQNRIAVTPTACVEPDDKTNVLKSASRVAQVDITTQIIVYTASIDSGQGNRVQSDRIAELIEEVVHADRTLGGLVIHCYVSRISSGYMDKGGKSPMRASRVTVNSLSQNRLQS